MTIKDCKAALAVMGWEYDGVCYYPHSEADAFAQWQHITLTAQVSGTGQESQRQLEASARAALVQTIKEHWKPRKEEWK